MMRKVLNNFPKAIQRRYKAFILNGLKAYNKAFVEYVLNKLPTIYAMAGVRTDADYSEEINQLVIQGVALEVSQQIINEGLIYRHGVDVYSFVGRTLKEKAVNEFGVNAIGSRGLEPTVRAWAKDNVRLIKDMLASERNAIASIVSRGVGSGLSVKQVTKQIVEQTGVTTRRATLIATNEIGNLFGQIEKLENERLGFNLYEWATALDERVRPTHKAMRGKICRWDDATVYKDSIDDTEWKPRSAIGGVNAHPSMEIRCRCTSYTIFE